MFLKRPLLLGTAVLGLVACNSVGIVQPQPTYPSYLKGKDLAYFQNKFADPQIKSVLVLHYHRFDNVYTGWDVWSWPEQKEGQAYKFIEDDKYGKIAIIASREEPGKRGFIVRKEDWSEKDTSDDRFTTVPASGVGEVWVVSGQKDFYTDPWKIDLSAKAQFAFLDSYNELKLSYSNPPKDLTKDKVSLKVDGVTRTIESLTLNGKTAVVKLATPLTAADIGKAVTVSTPGAQTEMPVYAREVLNNPDFTYSGGDLGATYTPGQTTFKVWTPVSSKVQVLLFGSAADTTPYKVLDLVKGAKGVWSGSEAGDLAGKYYQLRVTNYGTEKTTVDPYSRGASNYFENLPALNSKSAIVNLDTTDPAGWGTYTQPKVNKRTDVSVYEVHVRDFTVSETSGVDAAKRGKYLGMVQTGTRVPGTSIPTGIDHLKQLGVNTVQLLPVYDFGNETEGAYNWGYDPYLYNVPEAQYSTQPNDPAATIREFKTMVKGFHDNGLNVIMDVVYNHTKHTGARSPFDQLVPFYYYRTGDDGTYLNETGVGNVMATERPMVKNFVIDSLKYWVSEYHIQGFRFDLLGTFRKETVEEITTALTQFKPDIVMYGEPWTGGGPTYFGKGAQKGLNQGVFNDNFRNGIIGGVFDINDQGFIQGDFARAGAIIAGLKGSIDDFTDQPGESTNYATSHDNFVLWDHLSMGHTRGKDLPTLKAMQKMAASLVFTAQGLPFMSGGEEFARTKQGNGNSYNAGDLINAFDWTRLKDSQFADVNTYYSNIIKLRAAHPAFRMASRTDVAAAFQDLGLDGSKGLVGFTLDGTRAGDSWNHILVVFNANESEQTVTLPTGSWKVMVKGDTFSNTPLETVNGTVKVPRLSTLIAYADSVTPPPALPELPGLKGALNLDGTNLSEFDAASCSQDATAGTPWGDNNRLFKLCAAEDASNVYLGVHYRIEDNNPLLTFLSLETPGPATDLLNIDAWNHQIKFDASIAPSFFIAQHAGSGTIEMRQIKGVNATETVTPAAIKSVQDASGDRFLKVQISKSMLGSSKVLRVSSAIVGGGTYGGAVILPITGNTSNGTEGQIVFNKALSFSY